jgi:hypothetical protein
MISRNQVIEKIMKVYHSIEPGTINIGSSTSSAAGNQTNFTDITPNDPYYVAIREAEEL